MYEIKRRIVLCLSELFVKPDNTLVKEGDLLKNPKLAKTFRRIAADPFTFYNGTLAEDIIEDLREHGYIAVHWK